MKPDKTFGSCSAYSDAIAGKPTPIGTVFGLN